MSSSKYIQHHHRQHHQNHHQHHHHYQKKVVHENAIVLRYFDEFEEEQRVDIKKLHKQSIISLNVCQHGKEGRRCAPYIRWSSRMLKEECDIPKIIDNIGLFGIDNIRDSGGWDFYMLGSDTDHGILGVLQDNDNTCIVVLIKFAIYDQNKYNVKS